MREAIHRLTSPLFDWIPDISEVPPRRQATLGVMLSILLHLILIALFVIFSGLITPQMLGIMPPRPQPQEVELVVLPPPAQEPEIPVAEPDRRFINSAGLNEAKDPPPDAAFESDIHMRAASERPATGDVPLPSQDGVDRQFPNFTTQENRFGKGSASSAAATAQPQPAAPLYKPQPIPRQNIDPVKNEPVRDKQLQPAVETPPDAEMAKVEEKRERDVPQVDKPNENQIPLVAKRLVRPQPKDAMTAVIERPQPQPVPAPATPQPQPVEPPMQMAKLEQQPTPPMERPQPHPMPSAPGAQPELQKTRIEGSISNRGKAGVDAIGTPLGRYQKAVNDAIGSRWGYYLKYRQDLVAPGSLVMNFSIDDKGRIQNLRVDSNSSNASFADVCERAVLESELEAPPTDVIEPMKDRRMDYTLRFTFYTQ